MDSVPAATFEFDGIPRLDGTSVRVPPGVAVLWEESPERRSLLVQCLRIGLGSEAVALDSDIERGQVRMELDGSSYKRSIERTDGRPVASGDRYLDDAELADRYAFLQRSLARERPISDTAVLRDVLFHPSRIEEKRDHVEQLMDEVSELNQQLAAMSSSESELSSLSDRREVLEDRIEDLEQRLDRKESEIRQRQDARTGGTVTPTGVQPSLGEIRGAREDVRDIRYEIRTTFEVLSSLHDERRSVRNELRAVEQRIGDSAGDGSVSVTNLRREKEQLQRSVRQLQNVIELASGLLDRDGSGPLVEELADSPGTAFESVGEAGGELVCLMCGSAIESQQVEATVETLRSIRTAKIAEMDDLEAKIEERERENNREQRVLNRKLELERKVEDIESEIENRREVVSRLRDRRASLVANLEQFQNGLRSREEADENELLALEREATRLTLDLHRADSEWEDLVGRTNRIVERLEKRDDLRAERTRMTEKRAMLRAEIDDIEGELIERFNDTLQTLVEAIDPEPVEDVWLERRGVNSGAVDRGPDRTVPALYVSRDPGTEADSGDTVENVGTDCRSVAAFLTRLAGYIVHDVHETVPFMLVEPPDCLGEESVERTIEQLSSAPEYLIVSTAQPVDVEATEDVHRVRVR